MLAKHASGDIDSFFVLSFSEGFEYLCGHCECLWVISYLHFRPFFASHCNRKLEVPHSSKQYGSVIHPWVTRSLREQDQVKPSWTVSLKLYIMLNSQLCSRCLGMWVLFWRRPPEIPHLIAFTWIRCYGNGGGRSLWVPFVSGSDAVMKSSVTSSLESALPATLPHNF